MYDLKIFRERVQELYRRTSPYDNRRPNQHDLADAVGLNVTELSNRLNGTKAARLTPRDVRAIVRTLAEWGAIQTQAEATELLSLVDCPAFTQAEWQAPPLDALLPAATLTSPTPPSPAPPTHNLPVALTSFVGREQELATVLNLLRHHRLLTIFGAGGSGKTRLALEAGRRLLKDYQAGVWLVELAVISDPGLVVQTVMTTLGVREQPGRNLNQVLREALQQRELLLILDNCEHLVAACAALAQQLLTACPQLRMLVTSREVLHVRGEVSWQLPTLSLPHPGQQLEHEQLVRYEALQLFVERASLHRPDFALTTANAEAVRDICMQLDGLPLAIELAAARIRLLSAVQISQRLHDRLSLLTTNDQQVLPRQRTLRDLLDWSYDLLTSAEQQLFAGLAVFHGGFTLTAAEAVCVSGQVAVVKVMNPLAALVDKSLVSRSEDAVDPRFSLLETIREYAQARLVGDGTADHYHARHLSYYHAAAQQWNLALRGAGQAAAIMQLEAEHDNLRIALEWSRSQPDHAAVGLSLATELTRFWSLRGYQSEGQRWLTELLAAVAHAPVELKARALYMIGNMALVSDDYAIARQMLEQSLSLSRQSLDSERTAAALDSLARVALYQDSYAEATGLLTESLELKRSLGSLQGVALSLANLGRVLRYQGRYAQARQLFAESLKLNEELANNLEAAVVCYDLGELHLDAGAADNATPWLSRSLVVARQVGSHQLAMWVLCAQAQVAMRSGDLTQAAILLSESRRLAEELAGRALLIVINRIQGWLAYLRADYAQALTLARQSLSLASELGYRRDVVRSLEQVATILLEQG